MKIINKKYLLIILFVGIIITGVIILKPKENVKLDNVILKQEVNNKTFAMYKEEGNEYVPVEDNKFPDMYVLNLTKSKCIDNNGNELDEVLSYENDKVTITSGNTTYCYLYFDKSLGLEIKEKNPNKLSEGIKGAMYRFQGQQSENVNNYICFGTSNKEECVEEPDQHMYRIIGIEAETGRVKVIKMKALKEAIRWWDDYDTDIEFPNSYVFKDINGDKFLRNKEYVPDGWKEKISDNTWMYGDMENNDIIGARQTGEKLYLTETGQKETAWSEKANQGDLGALSVVVGYKESEYVNEIVFYIKHNNEKWNKTFESKISLMYLHDYNYSVGDEVNCQYDENRYEKCQTGWIHLSQNDLSAPNKSEWTLSRHGYWPRGGFFMENTINSTGCIHLSSIASDISTRPVFYIRASEELLNGEGTVADPFIIMF